MGNATQTPTQNQQPLPQSIVDHPHLGTIESSSNPRQPHCYLKIYQYADEMMGQQKMRRFNARIKKFANCDHIVAVRAVELVPRHEMCSNNSEVHLYFDKYEQSLRSVIEGRFKEKRVFTEQEIYQFVKQVLESLIFLQDNGFKNCHLDKDSIIISENRVKLIDMCIATSSPYQTFLDKQQPIPGFYLAPELLKDLKDRNYDPYLSPKSDIFCLGMLVLELACMENLDSYYDYQKAWIDYQSLIHRVSRIVYSVELKTLIAGMLEYQPELRLGLITAQEKVRKALHLEVDDQGLTAKRSRSSSTKMLKELLTNSRRTITASHRDDDHKSLTKKPSNASLTSMASLNSRSSHMKPKDKDEKEKKAHLRKHSEMFPSKQQTSTLKELVKNKLDTRLANEKPQVDQGSNKENNIKSINLEPASSEIDFKSLKAIQQARYQTFGYNSSFLASHQYSRFDRRLDSATPKINEPLENYNKQESIFKLIQEDSNYLSKPSQQNCNTTLNVPEFSPVPPVIPQVQETNSIRRQTPVEHPIQEVTEFDDDNYEQPAIKDNVKERNKNICVNIEKVSPRHSVSLRVKKSLDKMYKTTQSITSSEEKEQREFNRQSTKNLYKRVLLGNGYAYEGEVKDGDIFEGNGILYSPEGKIVYSGSWAGGLFDGFGTSYNLQVSNTKIDMKNFNENPKNWLKYQGEFSKGQRQGFGTIYYANGQRFSGCMRNGQINGYGCFYNSANDMTSGIWVNNRLQH